MPTRIIVPEPQPGEELRQIAESVADLHFTISAIVESAGELIPGENVDELTDVWNTYEGANENSSMHQLITNLTSPTAQEPISHETLAQSQLTGKVGKVKRSTLSRYIDRFFMYWNSEPRTDEKRIKSAEAASDYLEFATTFFGSIPGHDHIVELISLVRQLISLRVKRGA